MMEHFGKHSELKRKVNMAKNGQTKVEKIQQKSSMVMQKLLQKNYRNRFIITMFTLVTFLIIILGIAHSIFWETPMSQEWKEIMLLILGAFIGSYQRVIDFWFNNAEQDKEIINRADHEDDPEPSLWKENGEWTDGCGCGCVHCCTGHDHSVAAEVLP